MNKLPDTVIDTATITDANNCFIRTSINNGIFIATPNSLCL